MLADEIDTLGLDDVPRTQQPEPGEDLADDAGDGRLPRTGRPREDEVPGAGPAGQPLLLAQRRHAQLRDEGEHLALHRFETDHAVERLLCLGKQLGPCVRGQPAGIGFGAPGASPGRLLGPGRSRHRGRRGVGLRRPRRNQVRRDGCRCGSGPRLGPGAHVEEVGGAPEGVLVPLQRLLLPPQLLQGPPHEVLGLGVEPASGFQPLRQRGKDVERFVVDALGEERRTDVQLRLVVKEGVPDTGREPQHEGPVLLDERIARADELGLVAV